MRSADNGAEALSELVRMASTFMVQEGLEAEQADFVGRERYERGERNGYRSGYKPGKLDTAEGRLSVALPQVRDAREPFHSKLFELLKGDSQMLESLATEMYARGLSTRNIEAAFTDDSGVCLLSRTGVSEVTEALWEEYEAFQQRDLSDISVLSELHTTFHALYEVNPIYDIRIRLNGYRTCAARLPMQNRELPLVGAPAEITVPQVDLHEVVLVELE